MKVNFICKTDGSSLWSSFKTDVKCHRMELRTFEADEDEQEDDLEDFGELRAYFTKSTWNINKHGLIYTDNKWMQDFRNNLKLLGFTDEGVDAVHYSEQGMQGENFVSMDVEQPFIDEWKVLFNNKLN